LALALGPISGHFVIDQSKIYLFVNKKRTIMNEIIVEDIDELIKLVDPTEKDLFDLEQNVQALKLRQPKHPKIREAEQFLKTFRSEARPKMQKKGLPPSHETNVQKLHKSLAVLAECETQADDTLTELKRNRESIQRSQERLKQVHTHELPKAHRHVHSMLAWWK
jgi:uncharacterized protein YdiU (UPF0061 family)